MRKKSTINTSNQEKQRSSEVVVEMTLEDSNQLIMLLIKLIAHLINFMVLKKMVLKQNLRLISSWANVLILMIQQDNIYAFHQNLKHLYHQIIQLYSTIQVLIQVKKKLKNLKMVNMIKFNIILGLSILQQKNLKVLQLEKMQKNQRGIVDGQVFNSQHQKHIQETLTGQEYFLIRLMVHMRISIQIMLRYVEDMGRGDHIQVNR